MIPPIINETGKYLLVLSRPGKGDIIENKLLSGKDGELILKLFMDSGLKAKEFSFASATEEEDYDTETCRQYLKNTIELVMPTHIVSMGNTALNVLTKKSGIKKHRGQPVSLHESYEFPCIVYPTYSVDDLRNVPTSRKTIVSDLRSTRKQENAEEIEFEMWKHYED